MNIVRAADSLQLIDHCLADLARFHQTHPFTPAFILIPETIKSDVERRYLEQYTDSVLIPAEILSFSRFATRIFNLCGRLDRQPLNKNAKTLVIRHLIKQQMSELKEFKRVGLKSGFAREIVQRLGTLQRACFEENDFQSLIEQVQDDQLRRKLEDLRLIKHSYEQWLADSNFYEPEKDLSYLVELLKNPHPLQKTGIDFLKRSQIWICGFTGERDFTGDEYRLLGELERICESLTVTVNAPVEKSPENLLVYANGLKAEQNLRSIAEDIKVIQLADGRTPLRRQLTDFLVNSDATSFQSTLHSVTPPIAELVSDDDIVSRSKTPELQIKLVRTLDNYCQAAYVAGKIKQLLSDDPSLRLRDIAIALTDEKQYLPMLQAVLQEYGLAAFSSSRPAQRQAIFFRFFQAWSRLASGSKHTSDLVALLRSGMFTEISALDVDLLENRWLAYGNKYLSKRLLADLNDEVVCRPQVADIILKQLALADRLREAEGLVVICHTLLDILQTSGWYEQLELLKENLLKEDKVDAREQAATLVAGWNYLVEILQSLPELMPDEELKTADVCDLINEYLANLDFSTIPLGIDRIRISKISQLVNYPCRVLLIVGARAGVFPSLPAHPGMFNDREIVEINHITSKHLPRVSEGHGISQNWLLAQLLCRPKDSVYICSDSLDNEEVAPIMRHLSAVHQAVGSHPCLEQESITDPLVPSPLWHHRAIAERYLSQLQPCHESSLDVLDKKDPILVLPTLDTDNTSVSAIQTYNQCAYMYFALRSLQLRKRLIWQPQVNDLGNVAHKMLELMFKDLKQRKDSQLQGDLLNPQERERYRKQSAEIYQAWYEEMSSEKAINDFYKQAIAAQSGPSPFTTPNIDADLGRRVRDAVYLTLQTDRLLAEVDDKVFLPQTLEQRVNKLITVQEELANLESSIYALGIAPDQLEKLLECSPEKIRVCGVIDRIDAFSEDRRIIDYKTGRKEFDLEAVEQGLDLQLYVYAYLLRKDKENLTDLAYFNVKGLESLDADINREENLRERYCQIAPEQLPEISMLRFLCTLSEIHKGDISPLPATVGKAEWKQSPCRFCSYVNLCRMEKNNYKRQRMRMPKSYREFFSVQKEDR